MNRCDNCGRRTPTLHPFRDLRGRIIAWMCTDCAEKIGRDVVMVVRATRRRAA